MTTKPFIIERIFDAHAEMLWRAITEKDLMKQWYFDLPEFKAEVGFTFQFTGGPSPEKQYIHLCEITEVIPEKKLTYTWSYKGYKGKSFVTFELFAQGEKTKLKLTHKDIHTFPASDSDFAYHNFEEGWNHIVNVSLKDFLEKSKLQTIIK
jgi:uncharacterized protein YndB with AHSA1/START domain